MIRMNIPETIQYYANNKDAVDVFIDKKMQPQRNLEDAKNFVDAELFLSKLKYDCWNFRYNLWKEVWKKHLDAKKYNDIIEISDFNDGYQCHEFFYVDYKINEKKYRFGISAPQNLELFIFASQYEDIDKNNIKENALLDTNTKYCEKESYDRFYGEKFKEEFYTRSISTASWDRKTVNLEDLQKAAEKIIKYISG